MYSDANVIVLHQITNRKLSGSLNLVALSTDSLIIASEQQKLNEFKLSSVKLVQFGMGYILFEFLSS